MSRKYSLKIKLFILLLFVHVLSFSLGAAWLIGWNEQKRLGEIYNRVDVQADTLEDILQLRDGRLFSNLSSQVRQELDHEPSTYLLIIDQHNEIVDESHGPTETERFLLRNRILAHNPKKDQTWMVKTPGHRWIVQCEKIERDSPAGRNVYGYHYYAVNAEQDFRDLDRFMDIVILGGILLSLAASSASGLLIAYTTRNLRRFAQELRSKNPLKTDKIDFYPQSQEELQLYESYQEMLELVHTGAESQRLFIAHASHELKTPIASALAITELALSRPRTSTDYEALHREVLEQLQVLKRLSSVLLDFASLEDSQFNFRQSGTTDLASVLHLVLDRWSPLAATKGIRIELLDSIEALLPGREELWETVLSNLVDNAIKYGRQDGFVRLSITGISDRGINIILEDNGIGMGPEELARLGEVFFKAEPSYDTNTSFGLGFAHTKRIIARLGGKLSVQSEKHKGTRITITIDGKLQTPQSVQGSSQ